MDKQKEIQIIKDAPVDCEYSKLEILKIEEGGDMKYPAILKSKSKSRHQVVLAYKSNLALHIEGGFTGEVSRHYDVGNTVNITREYLANTYGEVVSPGHAEFIVELASQAGFFIACGYSGSIKFFCTDNESLVFCRAEQNAKRERKQITIPLPPKQIQAATPEEEFEMKQIMKNAGDNLVLGCEDSKCEGVVKEKQLYGVKEAQDNAVKASSAIKTLISLNYTYHGTNWEPPIVNRSEPTSDEWPKIGDEVLVYSSIRRLAEIKGKAVKVIGKCTHSDGDAILTVEHSSLGVFAVANGSWIQKPKTSEEELRDEIVNLINYAGSFSEKVAADALMSKYNITKKPQ